MTESDLASVLAIEQVSFSVPWHREHFIHEINAQYSFPFVAVSGDVVVGYVCLMSLFEEAQILDIAIASRSRGKGIARMLMEHAAAFARQCGAEFLALEVRASNVSAINLYEKCGFIRTGVRKRYYEGKEDAVLMEKSLI